MSSESVISFYLSRNLLGVGNQIDIESIESLLQVFGALRQAAQRAPQYPESHNLYGLACEARSDYQAAIAAYQKARCAIRVFSRITPSSHIADISANLARSLCRVYLFY